MDISLEDIDQAVAEHAQRASRNASWAKARSNQLRDARQQRDAEIAKMRRLRQTAARLSRRAGHMVSEKHFEGRTKNQLLNVITELQAYFKNQEA